MEEPMIWPVPPIWPQDLPLIAELLGPDEYERLLTTLVVGPTGALVRPSSRLPALSHSAWSLSIDLVSNG